MKNSKKATVSASMPTTLKAHGQKVLNKENLSSAEVIRSLYEYMEREGKIPEALSPENLDAQRRISRINKALDMDIKEKQEALSIIKEEFDQAKASPVTSKTLFNHLERCAKEDNPIAARALSQCYEQGWGSCIRDQILSASWENNADRLEGLDVPAVFWPKQ